MPTRRIPSGGLAALAVLLAALAVIVVAGAPLVRTIVTLGQPRTPQATTPISPTTTTLPTIVASRATPPGGYVTVPSSPHRTSTPARHRTSTPTTSTSTTTTTTTTSQPHVTPAIVPSLSGTFEAGATTVVARLGAVHTVTVSVPVGMRVTLSVTCGISSSTKTHTTSATVHMTAPTATCVATIRVPPSAPEPATWYLAAR
ncbi:MAG TPA: hypothetical protein VMQ40_07740 [Acidimicrobiales bacterium]|jgi:hypothetical protein|nr:hypothetical protein [Acidimicrobiales bacterium]